MNLVTRFLAVRRDRLLMKLGCWLVCFSLIIGLMLPQQKAETLVAELSVASVAGLAAAYLGACGLSFVVKGMDKDALVSSVQRLIQEFLDTELGGISIQDWLGGIWDVAAIAGKLILGRPLTDEFASFAQWVAGKYGAQEGDNIIYANSDKYFALADGSNFYLTYDVPYAPYYVFGTDLENLSYPLYFSTGAYLAVSSDRSDILVLYSSSGVEICQFPLYFSFNDYGTYILYGDTDDKIRVGYPRTSPPIADSFHLLATFSPSFLSNDYKLSSETLAIDRAPSMSYIPEGIEAEQGIALDVGAATTMDLDLVLQGVLDDVLAGTLESTMAAADEKVEPIDPPAGEVTDVDSLGLPALGQALTSRFPFSIPWDFFRAVQLLAAPAKAPYFEVDFMEPLADEVGGWKGSTTVVLDFAEYAVIGQVCRWTSTIGFCMMLAGATKRLIWTA